MIVTNRAVALNSPIQHRLTYGRGGIRIENNSRYTVYVSVGAFISPADIKSQAVLVLFPYQSRARKVNKSAILSLVASDQPYAINGTINGTLDQVVISEDTSTSPFDAEIAQDGLIGDYLVIAGGRIVATQDGFYARDQNGAEVLAVNLAYSWPWASRAMSPGDVMIGRGSQYLYWDNAAGRLTVAGDLNVIGGTADSIVSSGVTFGSYVDQVYWSSGSVRLKSGNTLIVTGSNVTQTLSGVTYLTIDPSVTTAQTPQLYAWDDIPDGVITLAVVVFTAGRQPSVFASLGGTLISGGQIITGSIITDNLSATAIDGMVITGATVRTNNATVPDVQMTVDGLQILADNDDRIEWINPDGTPAAMVRARQTANNDLLQLLTANSYDNSQIMLAVRRAGSINPRAYFQIGTYSSGQNRFTMTPLSEYADNAAAMAAGLGAGDIYRTGDLLKVVH